MTYNLMFGITTLVLASVPRLAAQSIPASADTTVSSAMPSQTFGASPVLTVDSSNRTYLRFQLNGSLPFGANANTLQKATLYVYVNKVVNAGGIFVSPVCTQWSEQTLTDINRPAACDEGMTKMPIDVSGRFASVDVTLMVKAWLNGARSNEGIILAPTSDSSSGAGQFDSKENTGTGHVA